VAPEFESIGYRTMRLNARRLFADGGKSEMVLLAIQDTPGAA
jgi:hypothetical protein